jgi:hypothetical protein
MEITGKPLWRLIDAQIEVDHQRPYIMEPALYEPGVEWLGPNCDHWLLLQLRRIARGEEPI